MATDTAPDWVTSTPEECEYQLAVFHEGGEEQFIELTRAEYIALKEHLANIRGIRSHERQPGISTRRGSGERPAPRARLNEPGHSPELPDVPAVGDCCG